MNLDLLIKFVPYVFPSICCTVFLIAFIISDKTFPKFILFSFTLSVVCAFFLAIFDALDYFLELTQQRTNLRQIIGSFNYIFRISCVGFLVQIAQRKIKRNVLAISFFVLFNAFFSILNIWTGWIFKIHPDHTYSFGVMINVPYFCILIFVIFFIQSIVKYFRTNMGESVAIIAICLICLGANIIEMTLNIKIVLGQAFSIAPVIYYLCLTTELYKRDALTEVFNRRSFFLTAKQMDSKSFGIIMLDLNDLKKFNDLEGHKAGDEALLTSVHCLQKTFIKYGNIYRLGGDEFAVILKERFIPKIESLLQSFNKLMHTTKYSMAYGYSIFTPGQDLEAVLEKADHNMYENKMIMKGSKPR